MKNKLIPVMSMYELVTLSKQKQLMRPPKLSLSASIQKISDLCSLFSPNPKPRVSANGRTAGIAIVIRSSASTMI